MASSAFEFDLIRFLLFFVFLSVFNFDFKFQKKNKKQTKIHVFNSHISFSLNPYQDKFCAIVNGILFKCYHKAKAEEKMF